MANPSRNREVRCLTCGCALHETPRTVQATCTVCGEARWPTTAGALPSPYVCPRCLADSPRLRANRASAARRRAARSGRAPSSV